MLNNALCLSNTLSVLYGELKRRLFHSTTTPFTKRIIVVPSQSVKSWLMKRFALDKELGVAAGFEIIYLTNAREKLLEKFLYVSSGDLQKSSLSFQELTFLIESFLREMLTRFSEKKLLNEEEEKLLSLIKLTHENVSEKWPQKVERRLVSLSDLLAKLFSSYGLYGEKMVESWDSQSEESWQELLWRQIFEKSSSWAPLYKLFQDEYRLFDQDEKIQLHIFGASFIPKQQFHYFKNLEQLFPVYYYFLSPCLEFWTDIRSDRECRRIQDFWEGRGASEENREALEELLRDRNPLLANLGRVSRKLFEMLEEYDFNIYERYQLPKGVAEHPQYQEHIHEDIEVVEKRRRLTQLSALQADLLLLCNPLRRELVSLEEGDKTVQLHLVSSNLREVELLYNNILHLIHMHSNDVDKITPSDILVVSPDIERYLPAIEMVFERRDSLLRAKVDQIPMIKRNRMVQGFIALLTLSYGRWEKEALFDLMQYSAFRRALGIGNDEVSRLSYWVKETGIRWGWNSDHRHELLQRDFCERKMVEESEVATWKHGCHQLLRGLAILLQEKRVPQGEEAPFSEIDFSQIDLLEKLYRLLEGLLLDLSPLFDGACLSIEEWVSYLKCLWKAYFSVDMANEKEVSEESLLIGAIEKLNQLSPLIKIKKVPFASIFKRLENILNQEKSSVGISGTNSIQFSSLKNFRSVPFKAIFLIGLEEESFPRRSCRDALNLMVNIKDIDYLPTSSDEDRQLFLEALFSAQNYFVMSYQGISSSDGSERPPSLLVEDLMNYLDRAFVFSNGQKPSQHSVVRHPFLSFHRGYFEEGKDSFRGYSHSLYHAAKAFYGEGRVEEPFFAPEMISGEEKGYSEEIGREDLSTIDIKELSMALHNPIQLYFNKSLGVYLEGKNALSLRDEEEFILTPLNCGNMRRLGMKNPENELLNYFEQRGKFPLGVFKEVAKRRVFEEVETWKGALSKALFQTEKWFDIELSRSCRVSMEISEGVFRFPPLYLTSSKGRKVELIGKINHMTSQGMIGFSKCSFVDATRLLLPYMVVRALSGQLKGVTHYDLFFLKDGQFKKSYDVDPLLFLAHAIDYYFLCLEDLSPLVPELYSSFILGDIDKVREHITQLVKSSEINPQTYNQYFLWMFQGGEKPLSRTLLEKWAPWGELLFGEMIGHWFPRMVKV